MKEEYKVGTTIKDGSGNEWVIADKYENGEWLELGLFEKKTGKDGTLRVKNPNNIVH